MLKFIFPQMRLVFIFVLGISIALGERAVFDSQGRLVSLIDHGEELAMRVTAFPPDMPITYSEQGTKIHVYAARGARLRIDVPREAFAGGTATLGDRRTELGPHRLMGATLLNGEASSFRFDGKAGALAITATGARRMALDELWERRGQFFTLSIALEQFPLDIDLEFVAKPDTTPVHLTVNAAKVRSTLQGFGGNYCFRIEGPETDYTLKNLKSVWARVDMNLMEWEPENDNDDPQTINWEYFKAKDQPGSHLRHEFELMKRLQAMGISYVASIWQLPEWLYTNPDQNPRSEHKRRVALDKWDELLECVGSYLLYAKQQYGAEPDLFSFNEANIGVYVLFEPDDHRQMLKLFGRYFKKLGLKTRLLLADATGPDGTHLYAVPAANDPEALQYCGAISFHSWGGTTPENYGAWGNIARWLNLPLLVTEVGVDAGAWRTRSFDTYEYGLREVRMYQELLLYARPQGLLHWQFTHDYGLVRVKKEGSGETVQPTARFHFMKQFANLTPKNSDSLTVDSDHPKVLFTAFAATKNGKRIYTLHIANFGSPRAATLSGLPADVTSLRAVRTSETEGFKELEPVATPGGRVNLRLAPRSLLTLTTGPVE